MKGGQKKKNFAKNDPPGIKGVANAGARSEDSRVITYCKVMGIIAVAVLMLIARYKEYIEHALVETVNLRDSSTTSSATTVNLRASAWDDNVDKNENKNMNIETKTTTRKDDPPSPPDNTETKTTTRKDDPPSPPDNTETKTTTRKGDPPSPPDNTETETTKRKDDPPSPPDKKSWKFLPMLNSVLEAREAMLQKLRKDYGDEYFEKIFGKSDASEGNDGLAPKNLQMEHDTIRPFGPKDLYYTKHWPSEQMAAYQKKSDTKYYHSVVNLRRKMMIKVLKAQKAAALNKNKITKYVWATGGHSAAAGHGNLFHESYTKVMEAVSSEVFRKAGLDLEARNYAMGGTSSAAEMSMCFKEIYGTDVDIFSWDFKMMEARGYLAGRLLHYMSRGLLSNKDKIIPAFVGLQGVEDDHKRMMEEFHDAFRGEGKGDEIRYDNNGLALFLKDEDLWKVMKNAIPDNLGLTGDEIGALPEFLRNFKCDGAIERGDPYCTEKKFHLEVCPKRMGQAIWHPGWKYHAMLGNSMALFLTEMLVGAVQQIEETTNPDAGNNVTPEVLLEKLKKEEDIHWNRMIRARTSQLPVSFQKVYWYNNTNDDWRQYEAEEALGLENGTDEFKAKWNYLDREALFRGPSICHTARIPAQTRFRGHLTNQPKLTGEQTVFGNETYFTGIELEKYHDLNKELAATNRTMPHNMHLVYAIRKEREEHCGDVIVKPDYHDYFMTEENEGWTTLEFPNKAEKAAYGYQDHKDEYKGILIMVHHYCAFDKCEKGFLENVDYNNRKWKMKVNGKIVTALTKIGHDAILLEHEDGINFEPNDEGLYRLEFKVYEPENFIKISAFVMF